MVRIVGSRALGSFPHHTVGSSTRIGVCPVVIGAPTVRLAEIVGAGCVAIAAAAAITVRLRGGAAASGRPPPAVRAYAGDKPRSVHGDLATVTVLWIGGAALIPPAAVAPAMGLLREANFTKI